MEEQLRKLQETVENLLRSQQNSERNLEEKILVTNNKLDEKIDRKIAEMDGKILAIMEIEMNKEKGPEQNSVNHLGWKKQYPMVESTRLRTMEELVKKQEAKLKESMKKVLEKINANDKKVDEKMAEMDAKVMSFIKEVMNKEKGLEHDLATTSVKRISRLPTPLMTTPTKVKEDAELVEEKFGDDSRLYTPVQIQEFVVKNEDNSGHQVQEVENKLSCNHTAAEEIERMVFDISPHSERDNLAFKGKVEGLKKLNDEGNNFFEYFEVLDVEQHVNLKDDDGNKQQKVRMEKKKLHFDYCDCDGLNNSKCIRGEENNGNENNIFQRGEENNGNENNIFQFQTVVVLQMETINFEKFYDKPFMLVSDGISDFGKYSFTGELVKTTREKAKKASKSRIELFTAFKGGTIFHWTAEKLITLENPGNGDRDSKLDQMPIEYNLCHGETVRENPKALLCANLACRPSLDADGIFCKRCSCYICHQFDENKEPSLWLICDYNFLEEAESYGISGHLKYGLEQKSCGILKKDSFENLDGYCSCFSCGIPIEVMRTWRKQLVAATEARRVDVLCQKPSLSYKIQVGSDKYVRPLKIVESMTRDRMIVNRLACGTAVQKLCASAVEAFDYMMDNQCFNHIKEKESLETACKVHFETLSPTKVHVILEYDDLIFKNLLSCRQDWEKMEQHVFEQNPEQDIHPGLQLETSHAIAAVSNFEEKMGKMKFVYSAVDCWDFNAEMSMSTIENELGNSVVNDEICVKELKKDVYLSWAVRVSGFSGALNHIATKRNHI